MKKKLTLIATAVALGALVVVGATMAYFTSSDTATNVITTGKISVKVDEPKFSEIAKSVVDETTKEITSELYNVMPNAKINKDPEFKLVDGSADAYIRVAVNTVVTKKDGSTVTPSLEDLGAELSSDKWIAKGGYYYYNEKIATSTNPVPLFKTLKSGEDNYTILIPEKWGNDFQDAKLNMGIKVEAVQADNFTPDFNSDAPWGNVEVE